MIFFCTPGALLREAEIISLMEQDGEAQFKIKKSIQISKVISKSILEKKKKN
jgi:hypothetical protein